MLYIYMHYMMVMMLYHERTALLKQQAWMLLQEPQGPSLYDTAHLPAVPVTPRQEPKGSPVPKKERPPGRRAQ